MSPKQFLKKHTPQWILYMFYIYKIYPKYRKSKKNENTVLPNIKFYSHEQTIDLIINNRMSLSRFGDGEFMWMMGEKHTSYQQYSVKLAQDLKRVILSETPNLLIGIPYLVFNTSKCDLYSRMWWETIRYDSFEHMKPYLENNKIYCDSLISRPYINFRDRSYAKKIFELWRRVWNNRDVVIVEGSSSKLGMGNDLFDNVKTLKRIICPAKNAYEKLDIIEEKIKNNVSKNTLILSALGPTATILASNLSDIGYQFIDVGHIDIEYVWYLKHAVARIPIPGKYVNESGVDLKPTLYDNDPKYLNSVIDYVD